MASKRLKWSDEAPAGSTPPAWMEFFLAHTLWIAVGMGAIGCIWARHGDGAMKLTGIAIGMAIVYGAWGLLRLLRPLQYEESERRRRTRREARLLCSESRRLLRRRGAALKPEVATSLEEHTQTLSRALASRDFAAVRTELPVLDGLVERHFGSLRKGAVREYAESVGVAVVIALLLRSFVVEAFKIPSGSMIPTLRVGDHIFVSKFIYGVGNPLSGVKFWSYAKPHRGDVIVFKFPQDPDKDFIKRVIGIEGDTIEIRNADVWVNGQKLAREPLGLAEYEDIADENSSQVENKVAAEFRETVDGKSFSIFLDADHGQEGEIECDFGCGKAIKVPAGSVFVMGDNRDNSHDSRYWGFVDEKLIKGKALFVWLSLDPDPEKRLLDGVRVRRFGMAVH